MTAEEELLLHSKGFNQALKRQDYDKDQSAMRPSSPVGGRSGYVVPARTA